MMTANLKNLVLATSTIGSLLLVPAPVRADYTGLYIGGGISAARLTNAEIDDQDIGTGDLEDFDDDRVSWQAYLGTMFTPHLGIEVGYLDLGGFSDHGFDIDGNGVTAAGILAFPVADRMSLYGKAGQVWWDVDADGPAGFDEHVDGSDWLYGAGLQVGLAERLALRFEYTRFELDQGSANADLDLATIAVQYLF